MQKYFTIFKKLIRTELKFKFFVEYQIPRNLSLCHKSRTCDPISHFAKKVKYGWTDRRTMIQNSLILRHKNSYEFGSEESERASK